MLKRVLLVDDEAIIRTGISQIVPWEENDLSLVYVAEDGAQALAYLRTHPVDIVITDIKMPVMDGIALVKTCIAEHMNTKFIALTGFNEFEYARTLMQCGVKHYLLKPCDETEIISACLALAEDCDTTLAKQEEHDALLGGAAQHFLSNYIIHGTCSEKDFSYFMPHINPSNVPFQLVLFRCNAKDALVDYGFCNIGQEIYGEQYLYHIILPDHIVLFLLKGDEKTLCTKTTELEQYALQYYSVTFSHTITEPISLHEISQTYWRALENRNEYRVYQDDCVQQMQQFVNENLDNPQLNLKWIARNHLYMNENYLSKLFIKSTGQKFTQYITQQRIERVKSLLQENPQMKLTCLCETVGLENNPAYLSTLFKTQTGLTITEYRKLLS